MPEIFYIGPLREVELGGVVCRYGEGVVFPASITERALKQDCWTDTAPDDPDPPTAPSEAELAVLEPPDLTLDDGFVPEPDADDPEAVAQDPRDASSDVAPDTAPGDVAGDASSAAGAPAPDTPAGIADSPIADESLAAADDASHLDALVAATEPTRPRRARTTDPKGD